MAPVINARNVSQYIDASFLNNTADKKLLSQYDVYLLVFDGMTVTPFVNKIEVTYDKEYKDDLPNLVDYLEDIFEKDVTFNQSKSVINIAKKLNINFSVAKTGKRKQTPTDIQEKGTTIIFNRILKSPRNVYPDVASLKQDTKLMGELKAAFTKTHEDKIEDWLVTYFEQQEKFFLHKKYGHKDWAPFAYNGDSFVKFFSTNIRLFANQEGNLVKKYTEWNPSDIWAAKNLKGMQKEIKDAFQIDLKDKKSPPRVSKLNALLIQKMNDGELVGISLKKIDKPQNSHIELINITPKSMKVSAVVNYKFNDLTFDVKNIAKNTLVTTYIKFKNSHDMNINLGNKKKFGNLSFNTQIKDSSAQGGQAPVDQVVNLLHSQGSAKGFVNDHTKYPHEIKDSKKKDGFWDELDTWKERYNFVKGKTSGLISWTDFKKYIDNLYQIDQPQIAVTKLMQVHFYYDAFKNYPNEEQFWISLLHLGMKVGSRFAPHAKISD